MPASVLNLSGPSVSASTAVMTCERTRASSARLRRCSTSAFASGLVNARSGRCRVKGTKSRRRRRCARPTSGQAVRPSAGGSARFPSATRYARGSAGEARRIEALLERFAALEARRHQRAGLLSGGEQQMLAIARGLMARPEVLMLDEPSLGLAPKLLEVLYDLLAELRGEGTTILLVDQMAPLALSVADRAYVLQSGTIKHSGSAREVAGDPALMRAYLGDHGTAR